MDHLRASGGRRIVRVYGAKSDNNAFQFKEGQDKVLGPLIERGEVIVVHEDWADEWKPESAKKIVNAADHAHVRKASTRSLLPTTAPPAARFRRFSKRGRAGKVLVTGQDAELVACQRIVAGTQAMTIYKPVKELADTRRPSRRAAGAAHVVVAREHRQQRQDRRAGDPLRSRDRRRATT